jgi:hypothetical protein
VGTVTRASDMPMSRPGCGQTPRAASDRSGLAHEHREGSLKSVLGVVSIAQYLPWHGQHQRPMALQDCCEGRLVLMIDEPIQKLGVGGAGAGSRRVSPRI